MATSSQIKALLESRLEGDDEQFFAIALQAAAAEARRGRLREADEIKALVQRMREQKNRSDDIQPRPIPIGRPSGELEGLLVQTHPKGKLRDMAFAPDLLERLHQFLKQQHHRQQLRHHGIKPNSKLLLIGPPGSGKTMTAGSIAGELSLPLFTIRLDALITRFLGETAAKMRLIFDQVARHRAVYLFDEFDALGSKRGATNDVGEMRRVLNSFLQFLEEPIGTDSIIIGATNHPELLDKALLRRFDDVLLYCLPSKKEIQAIIRRALGRYQKGRLQWKLITESAAGLSQAELTRAMNELVKDLILTGKTNVKTEDIINALTDRRTMQKIFSS